MTTNTIITTVDGAAMIETVIANVTANIAGTTAPAVPASVINLVVDQVVTGKVSSRKDRNAKGLLIEIDGNPMAYLPKVALAGRNDAARSARFDALVKTPGSEIEVVVTSAGMEDIKGVSMPRIKLSEVKLLMMRDQADREARENALADAVAALPVGELITGTVLGRATTKSDKNDGSEHCFGLFVEVAPGLKGLLHVSEIAGDMKSQRARLDTAAGTKVTVEVKEAFIDGGRVFIKVSEKSAVTRQAMARVPAGSKVTATVIKADIVGDDHGLLVNIGNLKGFLPESEANVGNIASLTKNRNQTVKVIVTGEMVGDLIKVTRKGVK